MVRQHNPVGAGRYASYGATPVERFGEALCVKALKWTSELDDATFG
jgi:hypothetical protein